MLLRFLRARKFNIEKARCFHPPRDLVLRFRGAPCVTLAMQAHEMLQNSTAWRRENKIDELISEDWSTEWPISDTQNHTHTHRCRCDCVLRVRRCS